VAGPIPFRTKFRNCSWNFAHKIQSTIPFERTIHVARTSTTSAVTAVLDFANVTCPFRPRPSSSSADTSSQKHSIDTPKPDFVSSVANEILWFQAFPNIWCKNPRVASRRLDVLCRSRRRTTRHATRWTFKGWLGQDMKLIMESNKSVRDALKIEDIAASARWAGIVEAKGRDFMALFFVSSAAQYRRRVQAQRPVPRHDLNM
jgi:hypothetical protein